MTTTVPLGDLTERITSGSRAWRSRLGSGTGRFLLTQCVRDGALDLTKAPAVDAPADKEAERTRVRSGDILITIVGDVGRAALVREDPGEAYVSQSVALVRPDSEVSPQYLEIYLRSRMHGQAYFAQKQYGVGRGHLLLSHLRELPVVLPRIDDQRDIAKRLEGPLTQLTHGESLVRRASAALNTFRTAAVAQALQGSVATPHVSSRRPSDSNATELLKTILIHRRRSQLNEKAGPYREPASPEVDDALPDGWTIATLEQITDPIRTISYGILMPKENLADGVPYVRVKDMRGDRIDVAALHRTSPEIASSYKRSMLRPGDILLAIRGSYGRVAEVPNELDGANITQDTARIDVSPLINHRYVAAYLRGPSAQAYFRRVARGVAVKGVNIGDLRAMPVPIPPRREQDAVATEVERRMSIVDEIEGEIAKARVRATSLLQSLLAAAVDRRLGDDACSEGTA